MPKPNILLITTDQQRYDTVGPRKPSFLRTPHLDQLACEGVTFSSAYSDCPVCVPARISIMNGKYVSTHGMYGNGATSKVLGRDDTLPGRLRTAGYQTAAIGKMHFGPQRVRHGFDEMILPDDYYREMRHSGHPLQPMRHGVGQNELYPTMATVPETLTLTSWTAERSVDYLCHRRDPSAPFFLWCSFSKPHPPLDPPEPYYSMYRNAPLAPPNRPAWCEDDECPPILQQTRMGMKYDLIDDLVWREAKSAYYGLITQIDYNIGRVLAALREAGVFDNTLIIFTSDHGELLGDFKTGAKCYPYEGSAHVPFIVRPPKNWNGCQPGTTSTCPVTHADILPTCLAAADGNIENVDGGDLGEIVRGTRGDVRTELILFGGANVRTAAITDGVWKYLWFPQGGREQLFNLADDPGETTDLAADAKQGRQKNDWRERLKAELQRRGSDYVQDGELTVEPLPDLDEKRIRAGCGNGYILDFADNDCRH